MKDEPQLIYNEKEKRFFPNPKITAYLETTYGLPYEIQIDLWEKEWKEMTKNQKLTLMTDSLVKQYGRENLVFHNIITK